MIIVNGTEISEKAIAEEMQYHPAPSQSEAAFASARALVIRELLQQEAARIGISEAEGEGETSEDKIIHALIAREISIPKADDASLRRYYESNSKRFRSPDIYEGAHILISAAPDDGEARNKARAEAVKILEQVTAVPDSFGELARAHSACPSGKNGGRLGQLTRGDTIDEFETFMFNLEPGQLCPVPVETKYGFHVMRLDAKADGALLPFDKVKARIADYLTQQASRRAVSQYLRILVGRAKITGISLEGYDTPLVQ